MVVVTENAVIGMGLVVIVLSILAWCFTIWYAWRRDKRTKEWQDGITRQLADNNTLLTITNACVEYVKHEVDATKQREKAQVDDVETPMMREDVTQAFDEKAYADMSRADISATDNKEQAGG
jgi:Na+-transporting methylmalonyl-CoA/oxaloacetate decarboxylase gamma subunit